jgi:hypothetical protein
MDTVYVVVEYAREDTEVRAVFATRGDARAYVKSQKIDAPEKYLQAEVWEVQGTNASVTA